MGSASGQTRIHGGTPRTDAPPRLLPNNTAWAISLILFLLYLAVVYGIDTREFEVRGTKVWSRFPFTHSPGRLLYRTSGPRAAYFFLPVGL